MHTAPDDFESLRISKNELNSRNVRLFDLRDEFSQYWVDKDSRQVKMITPSLKELCFFFTGKKIQDFDDVIRHKSAHSCEIDARSTLTVYLRLKKFERDDVPKAQSIKKGW